MQPLLRPARVSLRVVDSQQADNVGVLQDTLHLLLLSEENLGPELGVVDDLADALANRCLQRLNRSNGSLEGAGSKKTPTGMAGACILFWDRHA